MADIRLAAGIITLALLVCSCATNRVDNDLRGAVVRLEPDSVPLEHTADVTRFTVNVIIRNDRATPLYFGGCGPEAQQEINGLWQTVWSPVCISPGNGLIAPGDSLTFPFTVARFANIAVEPQLDPRATARSGAPTGESAGHSHVASFYCVFAVTGNGELEKSEF